MAFTKVTRATTLIKDGWGAFNTLIDDLLAVTNGKGASRIGIEDAAGNVAATNVEDAIAEIYTDYATTKTLSEVFGENSTTTTGLVWGYTGGLFRLDATTTTVAAGTIVLTDDATNYLELDPADGLVKTNTSAFTTRRIPLRTVLTASGAQSTSTDKRSWFSREAASSTTVKGVVELATDAETVTGTDTARAVTPANITGKIASNTETITGTSTTKITTPANVKAVMSAFVSNGFYAEEQSTPDLTIQIYSGVVYFGTTKVEYAGLAIADLGTAGAFEVSALTADYYNKILFTIDSSGTLAATEGTENAVLASVVEPGIPSGKLPICMVSVQDDGTGTAGTILTIEQSEIKQLQGFANITEDIFDSFKNLSFDATVDTKALTVALKGEDGNDPSASNSVKVKFRSATLTDADPTIVSVTSALSVVLPSGGTLGFTAAEVGRLYVWAINNAGTVELALSRTADIFPENNLATTVAIGAGSDSAAAMYSTAQRTSLACKCIGYIEVETGATEGEWDNAPSKVQVMLLGIKRTGDIIQRAQTQTSAVASGATVMPLDDSIPQITEGDEYMTLAITPTSAINKLKIKPVVVTTCGTATNIITAIFQDATANALAAVSDYTAGQIQTTSFVHDMVAGTTSSTTFRIRIGGQSSTITLNGVGGPARRLGGVSASSITITETFA